MDSEGGFSNVEQWKFDNRYPGQGENTGYNFGIIRVSTGNERV